MEKIDIEQAEVREDAVAHTKAALDAAMNTPTCIGYVFVSFFIDEGTSILEVQTSHVFGNDHQAAQMLRVAQETINSGQEVGNTHKKH